LGYDELTVDTEAEFILNEAGLNVISTSSYSKLGIRNGYDMENVDPSCSNSQNSVIKIYTQEQTGTDKDPRLEVVMASSTPPEEPPGEATTTIEVGNLPYNNELTLITGYIEHYTDSTTTPSEIEYIYYHIPLIAWLIIAVPLLWMFSRLLLELLIRLR